MTSVIILAARFSLMTQYADRETPIASAGTLGQEATVSKAVRASIVIVSYNAREQLEQCLVSVAQSISGNEIIVVDNGSVEGVADAIEAGFPGVMLIRNDSNLGFAAAGNLGAKRARGQYLVFLNQDTVVQDDWLDALLEPFAADDRTGLVTGKVLLLDPPNRINTCGNVVHFTGLTLCRGLNQPRELYDHVEEVDAISGAAFAIRRQLFNLLRGFDEDTFLYMEDTDLSMRARLAGWRSIYTPKSIVFHDYSLRLSRLKVFYQERNRYLMLLKNLAWPTLMVLLPAQLLAELITWGFVLQRDRSNLGNKLRAYWWIISNWRKVMRKRRDAQAIRKIRDRELLEHMTSRLEFEDVDGGVAGKVASHMFNPIFSMLRSIAMALIRW